MKFIDVRIKCLEDIKVTSALNQTNTNESLAYISGSTIRGAFISNYIRMFNIKDIENNEESKRWFFENGLEFLNGYIENDYVRTYPIMQGLYTDARGIEDYYLDRTVEVKSALTDKVNETDKKFSPCEFVNFENNGVNVGVAVNKIFNLHIKKGTDRTMFRYEAIEKGQIFRALIKVNLSEDEIEKVIKVLNDGEFYIGGSKGSGYGKVEIIEDEIEVLDNNPESIDILSDIKNEFIIFTTSDGIFIDESGNSISYIDEAWLEEMLGVKDVKLVSAVNEEILVGGYNNKWKVRLPQYTAVKKGSIFKYTFDGTINRERAEALQNYGYGIRTEEGYGRFIILPFLQISGMQKMEEYNKKTKIRRVSYTEEEQEQIQFIVNAIAKNNIEKKMREIIVSNYSKEGKVNDNQVGKLVQLFSLAQKKSKEDGVKSIRDYIEHLENSNKKKSDDNRARINQESLNQLKDLKLNGKSAKDFILSQINEFSLERFYDDYNINSIKIANKGPRITEQEAYVYKMIELENTFRYILRSKDVE